jgi:zinc and cadmium transporter
MTLIYILLATALISLFSLVGILFLSAKKKFVERIIVLLISLAAGTMMGGTFLHILPEATESLEPTALFTMVLLSFILFYLIERVLHWRHCHHDDCKVHTKSVGYLNLIGDGIHNFIDGMVVASAFMADFRLGMVTTLAIAMHEIPQEIGDFGVLLRAGFTKKKALLLNLVSALAAVIGALVSYFASHQVEGLTTYMLPIAAGGFLYISASDLLPEIRKEENMKKAIVSFIVFLFGVWLMYLMTFFE